MALLDAEKELDAATRHDADRKPRPRAGTAAAWYRSRLALGSPASW